MYAYWSNFTSGAFDPTWPHFLLIGGSLVGGALVGLGVILEAHKIFSLPTLSVFIGIVLEAICTLLLFTFDEGISKAQTDKIITLEERIAPRNLSPSQQQKIADSLRQFSDVQFVTVTYPTDPEGRRLEQQVWKVMSLSGFRLLARSSGMPSDPLVIGLQILSNDAGKPLAKAACEAFVANDIECTTDGPPVAGGSKTLTILVGVKPIAEP
jgi:hypothetical protein